MKRIRRIRPLCWFLLVWFIFVGYLSWEGQTHRGQVPFALLMIIHLGIYWVGFSMERRSHFHWISLLVQAGLVLLLTQVSQDAGVAFGLSLAWFVGIVDTLKQVRPILVAVSGYLILMFFYIYTLGSGIPWQFLVDGKFTELELLALFVLAGLILYLQQEHAHRRTHSLLQELNIAHAQLSAYALRVEELTMLTERQRIARDLHDTLIQGVTGVLMQLNVAQTQLQHQKIERAQELVGQAMEDARNTVADARCALGDLRTLRIRPDDLIDDVQEEISHFTETTEIPCQFDLALLATTPIPFCEHVLRFITEALANVARHAHARSVWVRATQGDGLLAIEVSDDGVGFDPTVVSTQIGHYGLLGIRERATLAGGQLEITSTVGAGTTLRLRIPTQRHQEGVDVWTGAFVS